MIPPRYLSRVDLLRQLVSSLSRVIPSIQELAKPELARRVRDRLVQEDQYDLAMEVSTKCQLDASLVWSAWGMASLRCGEVGEGSGEVQALLPGQPVVYVAYTGLSQWCMWLIQVSAASGVCGL